jgi:aryl-alcohol dehydrogenase-like predicted oxidoreductase
MKYRQLADTGVFVSELCLGTMTFGGRGQIWEAIGGLDQQGADALVHRALDAGINFVDTANVYASGESETMLGRALGNRRRDVILATKVRGRMGNAANQVGLSRLHILEAVDASLARLGTDYIDLYQIHRADVLTNIEDTLRALDDLVRAGKVLYIGCSNYAAYRLMDSLWLAKSSQLSRYITLQAQYSLLVRDLEREHVPLCRETGLGILPWSPLAGGFLTGKFERGKPPQGGTRLGEKAERFARYDLERNWKILDAVKTVATEVGATPSAVSIAWLLAKPQVTSVIFGARTIEQLDVNLRGAELELSAKHVDLLDTASAIDLGYPYEFIKATQAKW